MNKKIIRRTHHKFILGDLNIWELTFSKIYTKDELALLGNTSFDKLRNLENYALYYPK